MKNYTTIKKNFGGFYSEYLKMINKTICNLDGSYVLTCLTLVNDAIHRLYEETEEDNYKEKEAFIILSYDNEKSDDLQFNIYFDLNDIELIFDYPIHAYRLYVINEEWGLDEIELTIKTMNLDQFGSMLGIPVVHL